MNEMRLAGTTLLFVSHSIDSVREVGSEQTMISIEILVCYFVPHLSTLVLYNHDTNQNKHKNNRR